MATKKTEKTSKAAPKKVAKKAAPKKAAAPKKEKAEAKPALPRHPRARVVAAHGSKADLAKTLAAAVARADEDKDQIAQRLKTASNAQLLRLQHVVATVKEKYGSRDKLIAAIGTAEKKSGDKDYLAKLASFSLPHLLDLATSAARA